MRVRVRVRVCVCVCVCVCVVLREETPLKLLLLKCIYLIVDTPSLSQYFYGNDLRVLIDVFLRELADLPDDDKVWPVDSLYNVDDEFNSCGWYTSACYLPSSSKPSMK